MGSLDFSLYDEIPSKYSLSNLIKEITTLNHSVHPLNRSIVFSQNAASIRNVSYDFEKITIRHTNARISFNEIIFFTMNNNYYFFSYGKTNSSMDNNPKYREGVLLLKSKLQTTANEKLLQTSGYNPDQLRSAILKHIHFDGKELGHCIFLADYEYRVHIGQKHREKSTFFDDIMFEFNLPLLSKTLLNYIKN